jgi:L-threonylcarbamoyladenylate synthase
VRRLADTEGITAAAEILRRGGLVAFPTETVYGLGAHALDAAAVRKIFEAKERPAFNPLIVHVTDARAARALVTVWPPLAEALAQRFWPGPLTLVLPRATIVPDVIAGGGPTVAIRSPAHPVARALLAAAGIPIAAPSANRFTELSPVTAEQVERSLGDRVELILDGGRTTVGIESTVVDLSGPVPMLLRPGTITQAELETITGPLTRPVQEPSGECTRPSPGMSARHYAPRAPVQLVDSPTMAATIAATVAEEITRTAPAADARRIGLITWSHTSTPWAATPEVLRFALPADAAGYAAELYHTLHRCDEAGCRRILVERPPNDPAWEGVRDRLTRAAHP